MGTTGAGLNRVNFLTRFRKIGIGVGFFSYDYTFSVTDFSGNDIGDYSSNGGIFTFAAGVSLRKNISAGFRLSNLRDSYKYADISNADDAVLGGFGILWKPKRFRLGFQFVNFGGADIWGGDQIPSYGRISAGYESEKFNAGFSAGGDQISDYSSLGVEYRLAKWIKFRAGIENSGQVTSPTVGIGLKIGRFALDFASSFHPDLGPTTFSSVRYAWGEQVAKEAKARPIKAKQAVEEIKPVELSKMMKPGEKINIAVTDFEARAPLSQSEAAFISDFVRSDIVKSDRFNVVEKNNMDKVLAEQGFQQTGCSSAECAVQIGKILNVKLMIVGSCGQLLGQYVITMNVVDVESAKIVYSDDLSVSNSEELRTSITQMVRKFTDSVR